MQNLNLQTLSSYHLAAKYYLSPWLELRKIKTLKKLRLISGSYFSETRLKMFNITYVRADPFYGSKYVETGFQEEISVVVEYLIYFGIVKYIGMGLYLVLWDVVLYIEND